MATAQGRAFFIATGAFILKVLAPRNILEAIAMGYECFEIKPCEPTSAPPGTKEKVQVLAQRVLKGQELWHEDDVTTFEGLCGVPVRGASKGKHQDGRPSVSLQASYTGSIRMEWAT